MGVAMKYQTFETVSQQCLKQLLYLNLFQMFCYMGIPPTV